MLHAREVLGAAEGDVLRVGRLGGLTGLGTTLRVSDEELLLRVELTEPAPALSTRFGDRRNQALVRPAVTDILRSA